MDETKDQLKESAKSSWDKLWDKIEHWGELIVLNLPNFILAVIIFVGAFFLSKLVKSWTHKILQKPIRQVSIRHLIANVLSIIVIGIGLVLALNVMNLNQMLTSILAGAGVVGLAVGLALQGTLSNTFSGIFLALRDVISVGDWIETNGFSGTVIDIDLRNTQLKESDNNIVVLPNQMILDNPFKNYGLTQRVRCTINCGVGYESDLDFVKETCVNAIKELFPPNSGENIEFHYLEFGGSSIDFQVRFWANSQKALTSLEAKTKAIMAIKKAFDQHDINIPFPIRTLQHSTPLEFKNLSTQNKTSEEEEPDQRSASSKESEDHPSGPQQS